MIGKELIVWRDKPLEQDYLIKKPPFQALFIFALPIIIGNLFQQTYTMADSAIVGRFVSEQALAAVGASYSLTNIFICVAIGGGMGASVIVSQYFGAQKYDRMKTAIYTASLAFLGLSLLLGIFGLFCSQEIMVLLNTPADCLSMASEYLQIYFLGLPFLFMYNVFSAMFNALGKSRIPLGFLIFSSLFNIVLDYLLVAGAHMGVSGVAWATLIAQGISAVLSMLVLLRILKKISSPVSSIGDSSCSARAKTAFPENHSVFDGKELVSMTRIAIPSILQQSTVSIGMMLVQSVVNSFGSTALAGFSAAMRIESICVVRHWKCGLFLHCTESGCRKDGPCCKRLSCCCPDGHLLCCHPVHQYGMLSSFTDCSFPWYRRCHRSLPDRRRLPHFHGMVLLYDRF